MAWVSVWAAGVLAGVVLASCGPGDEGPSTEIPGFNHFERLLTGYRQDDFRVTAVENEGGALKVTILLSGPVFDPATFETRTTGALRQIQKMIGTRQTLAVWSYRPLPGGGEDLAGMAYYSARTEFQHFKSKDELQQP